MPQLQTTIAKLVAVSLVALLPVSNCHAQSAPPADKDEVLDMASMARAMPLTVDIEMIQPWIGWYKSGVPFNFRLSNKRLLLGRTDVRKELSITRDQQVKLDALTQQFTESVERRSALQKSKLSTSDDKTDGSNQATPGLVAALKKDPGGVFGDIMYYMVLQLRNALLPEAVEYNQKLETVLSAPQLQRLNELDMQWRGLLALAEPDTAHKLKLNELQNVVVERILKGLETALCVESNRKFDESVTQVERDTSSLENDVVEIKLNKIRVELLKSAEMRRKRARAESDVRDLLTDDQKAHWNEITGPNFVFRSQ